MNDFIWSGPLPDPLRSLAALGFLLLVAMQILFVATGGDRPFPYTEVQVLSILGSLALVAGVLMGEELPLAGGFAVNALGRVAQIALGLSRLPLILNLALAVGWIWATVAAARGQSARGALWFLGAAHAVSMLWALGRFSASIGLALGATGLFLAAPHVGRKE